MRKLFICAKCSDLCTTIFFVNNEQKAYHDGYVPEIKGIGGGDYVELEIDLDTGQILNWISPSNEEVLNAFNEENNF